MNCVEAVAKGHYARKQLDCRSWIISWSHRSRFRKALSLVGVHPERRLLDYGCGDGTFLAMASGRFGSCVGVDISEEQIRDCSDRFQQIQTVRFCRTRDLGSEDSNAYDVVTSMETLEHCTESIVEEVLADLVRLAKPRGQVIISVPIETGLAFLVKYAVRAVAGWRGLSDYRYYERYSLPDAYRMVLATKRTQIRRPAYGQPGFESHSHYGFNWRRLRSRIKQSFTIESTLFTPVPSLGWLSSQAWFVCRPK
jgi:ubiquinone/menaquinone biosynthesis C-methylase UbiE